MPEFTSERSLRVLSELSAELYVVVTKAIELADFSLIDGARTTIQQQSLFAQGVSKADGVTVLSKHQINSQQPKSRAFDFIPEPFTDWDDRPTFTMYAGLFLGIAYEKGIRLRWGGDWDGDFSWRDQSFHDIGHIEQKDG